MTAASLVGMILLFALIGLVVYLVVTFIKMPPEIARMIVIIACVVLGLCAVLWILSILGINIGNVSLLPPRG